MTKPLTGQTSTLKRINVALVKNALRVRGTATRRELSEVTNLSQPTVNAIINMLREENEVVYRGSALSSGGRRAELYALNHEHQLVAAVFAMSDHLDFAVTNTCGTVLSHGTAPIAQDKDYAEQISSLILRLIDHYPNIRVAGVTFPSAVTAPGELFAAPQMPHLERMDMGQQLQKRLPIPVVVENDVKLRALGYYRAELMRKTENMVYLHLSTGLGAGVILNGHCHCGYTNFSGEVSYMCIADEKDDRTLEEILTKTTDQALLVKLMSRLALSLICIVNPPFFVMGGGRITSEIVEQVKNICMQQLPKGVMPHFLYAADESQYLYGGIASYAQEQIDSELRIVRAGEA